MANGELAFKNTQDRRNSILQILKEQGSVRNSDLSHKFNCSEVTIRNDIREMNEAGVLTRTRGGAITISPKTTQTTIIKTVSKYVDEKKRIALKAYESINTGDTVLIDDSSTGYYLASYIAAHPEKELTVVTNGVKSAYELSEASHIELHIIGGYVGGQTGGHLASTLGDEAVDAINKLHVDKGFIGVHSVNLDVGITSIATPQMQVKRAIINSSKQLYVLADHSKFENGYLSIVCPMSDKFILITDNKIDPEILKRATSMHLNFTIV